MSTQEVLYAVTGQYLVLEVDRPLTSITSVAVYELDGSDTSTAESATTGSASVDSATESTTAAAGAGQTDPTKITMASTAGFVAGRRAYISKAGLSETFEIARIDSNTAIYARHPLVNAYASSATVDMTTRATIGVDSAWVAESGNVSPNFNPNARYRVRWVVVHADDSTTAVYFRNMDLVRYPSAPPVSPLDVDTAHPGWLDALPSDHRSSQGRQLIIEATRAVRFDLYARALADQAVRNAEVYAALVIDRAVMASVESNGLRGADVALALDIATRRYERRLAGLVDSRVLALDTSGDGAAATKTGVGQSVWSRTL